MPELVVDGVQRTQVACAGVVEEHVEPAGRVHDGAQGAGKGLAIAHVERMRAPTDLLRDPRRGLAVTIEHGNRCALGRETHRGGTPDSRCATSNDRYLPVELSHGRRR